MVAKLLKRQFHRILLIVEKKKKIKKKNVRKTKVLLLKQVNIKLLVNRE